MILSEVQPKSAARDSIPSPAECMEIIRRSQMRENIIRHSLRVRDVAVFLAAKLREAGNDLDLSLIEAAALLHDITKTRGIITGERHAETGQRLLEEMGYHLIGQVVGGHVRLRGPRHPERITEEEVVHYADKRVMHERIVSLDERYSDLRARYGVDAKALAFLQKMENESRELEKKLFSGLGVDPSALLTLPEQESPSAPTPSA